MDHRALRHHTRLLGFDEIKGHQDEDLRSKPIGLNRPLVKVIRNGLYREVISVKSSYSQYRQARNRATLNADDLNAIEAIPDNFH